MKNMGIVLVGLFALAACGGGSGFSGAIPEPIAFTEASDIRSTGENVSTPPTREETRERAERRVQEEIEKRKNVPTPWNETYYKTELENAIKDLQDAINYGYREDSAHVQNPKNRIAKYTEIKRLYEEWLDTGNQNLRNQINEIINPPYYKEWQKEFGYVDSPEQTEDLRKYNKQYQHLAFNEWLGTQPDLERDYYLKENGSRIGYYEGRTKYLPTSNLTYTGKYLGFSEKENLEVKGDLTANIKGESFNLIDFTFKGLNEILKIDNLLEHEHYDFGTVVYDENGKNPVLQSPTITGGSFTDSDIIIEGKIFTGPVVNGKTQSSGSISGRIKSEDRNLRLLAVILGNNHEGIVGHINRGDATNGNLELRFGAEKN